MTFLSEKQPVTTVPFNCSISCLLFLPSVEPPASCFGATPVAPHVSGARDMPNPHMEVCAIHCLGAWDMQPYEIDRQHVG